MDTQDPVNKAKESAANVMNEALTYFGKAADASVEMQREFFRMQQEFFNTWTNRWRDSDWISPAANGEDMKKLKSSWTDTMDQMLAKRREVFEIQYQSAVETMEEGMRLARSANPTHPEEFGEKVESFCRASLTAWQKSSDAQLQEFQNAARAIVEMSASSFGGMSAPSFGGMAAVMRGPSDYEHKSKGKRAAA